MTFELTREEYDLLTLALGIAVGAASRDVGTRTLMTSFLRLANTINKDNPNWAPYDVPPKEPG